MKLNWHLQRFIRTVEIWCEIFEEIWLARNTYIAKIFFAFFPWRYFLAFFSSLKDWGPIPIFRRYQFFNNPLISPKSQKYQFNLSGLVLSEDLNSILILITQQSCFLICIFFRLSSLPEQCNSDFGYSAKYLQNSLKITSELQSWVLSPKWQTKITGFWGYLYWYIFLFERFVSLYKASCIAFFLKGQKLTKKARYLKKFKYCSNTVLIIEYR